MVESRYWNLVSMENKLDPCSEVLVKRSGVVRPPRHISPSLLRPTRQIANEHHAALEKKT